jgi:hypothetical protein
VDKLDNDYDDYDDNDNEVRDPDYEGDNESDVDMYESDEEEEVVNLDVVMRQEQPPEEIQVYSTWILPLREQMATQTKIQERKK